MLKQIGWAHGKFRVMYDIKADKGGGGMYLVEGLEGVTLKADTQEAAMGLALALHKGGAVAVVQK